jgi:hypothetical protein
MVKKMEFGNLFPKWINKKPILKNGIVEAQFTIQQEKFYQLN